MHEAEHEMREAEREKHEAIKRNEKKGAKQMRELSLKT